MKSAISSEISPNVLFEMVAKEIFVQAIVLLLIKFLSRFRDLIGINLLEKLIFYGVEDDFSR